MLAQIFVEISYSYQQDYTIDGEIFSFLHDLSVELPAIVEKLFNSCFASRMPRSAVGAVAQKEPSCGGRTHLGEAMRAVKRGWKLTASPRE